MNNKGFVNQMMLLLILGATLFVFILVWLGWSVFGPIIVDTASATGNAFSGAVTGPSPTNLSEITNNQISGLQGAISTLEWITLGFFIMIILAFLIFAYNVRSYPYLAFVWILFIVVAVFLSMYASNVYLDFANSNSYSGAYSSWEFNDMIMRNLPAIIAVVGAIMGILLFMAGTKDPAYEVAVEV